MSIEIITENIKFNEIESAGENFDSIFYLDVKLNEPNEKVQNFIGKAFIYDEEIYINTMTGQGYDRVISKMKAYINWYSGKIRLAGFDREDIKQLIVTILLDGIRRYNPTLKIKLSTFLYVHIKNRIISRIKEETKQSLSATYIETIHRFICPCGVSIMASKKEAAPICGSCKKTFDSSWTIYAEHIEPLSLNIKETQDEGGTGRTEYEHDSESFNSIDIFNRTPTIEDIDRQLDIMKIINSKDDTTYKIAKLMYNDDYSITDAAQEVGLSCWAASLRLKKLKNNKAIKEVLLNK